MKYKTMLKATGFVAAFLITSAIAATPVGTWKTIDDETKKAKSYVKITESNGVLYGKIVKLINPSEPDPKCTACKGKKKGQSITGMTIIWGAKKNGDKYTGGKILSPSKGKIYKLKMWNEGEKKLKIRGYIGFFYRTQTWYRIK